MLWQPEHDTRNASELGAIAPERVLVEYDGIHVFTFRDLANKMLLAYHCDEDDAGVWRYTIVPCSETTLNRLIAGQQSIVSALAQSWGWIADISEGEVKSLWEVDPTSLPDDYRPQPNVFLTHVAEPDLSVRYVGRMIP